ncbi:hypothetical protein M153_3290007862 [Pseudoloma neurophilia]|uniref:ISXO2-like transposase domain-containing protein n=1 Tax=Pseudoloma neurophilia TaxID=146866 RepID=A0A0R0M3X9_9MICR|nr:hypothetical protein M153_3290007862 [Pseudoloma neurophilia]
MMELFFAVKIFLNLLYVKNIQKSTNEQIFLHLRARGLLKTQINCPSCGKSLVEKQVKRNIDGIMLRCLNKLCEEYQSYFSIPIGSFFENSKLRLETIFEIIYRYSKNELVKITSLELEVSHPTVTKIHTEIRSIIRIYYDNVPMILDGPNRIVEIDESLFVHKTKYNVGRFAETQVCVFSIADTTFTPAKVYLEVVESRSAQRLLPIIKRVVLSGSTIHSDQWAEYNNLQSLGYVHQTVNHKYNFIDPQSGAHTQHIESFWKRAKLRIKQMKVVRREKLQEYLFEIMFKENNGDNSFNSILDMIFNFEYR